MEENESVSTELVVSNTTALGVIETAQLDIAIRTARAYPRSISRCLAMAKSLATLDEETAKSCIYSLPRGGEFIRGKSVRIAEIMASSWEHMRVASEMVEVGETYVEARGVAWDIQQNVSMASTVRVNILYGKKSDKRGQRYDEDLISLTCAQACAKAGRNAILKVIPMALINQVYRAAVECGLGKQKTLTERRAQCIEAFTKLGISMDQILARIGRRAVDDIDLENLTDLTGVWTAIKDGDITIEAAFPEIRPESKTLDDVTAKLKAKQDGPAPAPASPTDPLPAKGHGGRPAGSRNKPKEPATPPAPDQTGTSPDEGVWDDEQPLEKPKPATAPAKPIGVVAKTASEILVQDYKGTFPTDLNAARALVEVLTVIQRPGNAQTMRVAILNVTKHPLSGLSHEQCVNVFNKAVDGEFDV